MKNKIKVPLFQLGQQVITPNARNQINCVTILQSIRRHVSGDWGDLNNDDKYANNKAVKNGDRILSVYHDDGKKFWIITEGDRSSTCVLMPEDY